MTVLDRNKLKSLKIGTRAILAAAHKDFSNVKSHIPPLYQTVNFEYSDIDEGLAVFRNEKSGYVYTRESNPTTSLFAEIVAFLEEGESALSTASGMAAISSTLLSLVKPGDHILCSSAIYGGTRSFFRDQLGDLGIQSSFVDITDIDNLDSHVKKNTSVLYTEVVGNPNLVVADIPTLASFAKKHKLQFIVDSTFTPPPIIQPIKLGADIVLHSATKYLGGHGDIIGGVVVGRADIINAISHTLKMYGGAMSPFNAWLAIRGVKTLGVRIRNHCQNALDIALFLEKHPKIKRVYYPGLTSHKQFKSAEKQLSGFGGMVAFELDGGFEAAKRMMKAVEICSFTVSLGEIDTLIMHPASTSHVGLSPEERASIGVSDGLIRLSVGIEDIDDLLNDLQQALNCV